MTEEEKNKEMVITVGKYLDDRMKAYHMGQLDALICGGMQYRDISYLLSIPLHEVIKRKEELSGFISK